MTNENNLTQLIDKLVAEKTFGLEGLQAVQELRDKFSAMEREVKSTELQLDAMTKTNNLLLEENKKHEASVIRYVGEIASLNARVAELEALRVKAECAIASGNAYKEILHAVFKPNTVRESIQSNVAKPVEGHPGGNGSYPSAGFLASATESHTIVREQG